MSVCRFSRPTSCRPCLTSSIALSYRILSGSAVFSALVDLLTFFFLRNTCASDRVALSRSSPIITNRVHRIVVGRNVDHLAVASNEVRRPQEDRKSTRLNSSHLVISYAVFCLKQ